MISKGSSTICQKHEGLKVDQHDYSRCSTSSASEVLTPLSPATRPLDRYIMKGTKTYSNLLISFLHEIVNAIFLVVFIVFAATLKTIIHLLVACTIAYRILDHRHTIRTNTTGISSEEQEESGVSFGLSDLQKLSSFKCEMVEPTQNCIVCLERFINGERCRSLPGCNHVYHANCVDSWLIRFPSCPLCRKIVVIPGMDPLLRTDSHG
ncbi:hypothetical protein MKW94_001633 [Papaver nudicaule]|uniref:RING-type domain-containing protein n=1 Tax=Papaver nudicaule TaxID=74823 RepID=A0AA41RLC1_PAPNU|nr:hypothetical protein [Papaver nudicaule]